MPALQWPDRYRALYHRLLGSPRFRRWAAAFPLTRPTARREARALFDLCAGFVYSQILFACVRLRLFEILSEGPQKNDALAIRLGLSADATARLLDAAISLRLVARCGDQRFGLGSLGATLVGNDAITAMVEHHALLYVDLRDPVALLRDGAKDSELARYWPYSDVAAQPGDDLDRVAAYSALMSSSQPLIADEVLDAYSFKRHRCLLDVGGGEGTFLTAVAARVPVLQMILFDLPPVAERARVNFSKRGLNDRARAVGGSFLSDSLPDGADVISLVRVIHDHDDDAVLTLLRAAHRALPPHGVLIIAEPMSSTPGAEPIGDAYFGFYLLAMGRGRPRTPTQIKVLLETAGFDNARVIPTHMPLQTSVMTARVNKKKHQEENGNVNA